MLTLFDKLVLCVN